ncbi:glycosyltransferase family 1 protein [Terribacillus sp. FSL K6-0262]|uniref:glycosyltransferase family 4 protein n=1 Tax=Terribacillus sp. FSL K6-0262 TaxID=2921447 RepID=UPI0030EC8F78
MGKIYINGRFLTQKTTGVQRVAIETIKQIDLLLDKYREYNITLLVPKGSIITIELNNIIVKQIGKNKGHIWEQIDLPLYVKKETLVNFCNTAPVFKKNQIVYIHDMAIQDAPEGFSKKFVLVYKLLFKKITRNARKIITVSNFSKERILNYYPNVHNKISVSYLGVNHFSLDYNKRKDLEILKSFKLVERKYFLAVSSANPNKNFSIISRMLAETSNNWEEEFVFVGSNNSTVFRNNNIETKSIRYLGYVSDDELHALYRNARLFIFPSKYEGFGLPPIEAMRLGCQVIANKSASIPEILEDKARYFDGDSINSLEQALSNINKNNQISRTELMNFVNEKYNWKETASHLMRKIKEIQGDIR